MVGSIVPVGVSVGTVHQGVDVEVKSAVGVDVSAMAVRVCAGPTGVNVLVGPPVGVLVGVDVFVDDPPPEPVLVGVLVGVEVLACVAVFTGVFVKTGAPGPTNTGAQNWEVLLLKSVAVAKTWSANAKLTKMVFEKVTLPEPSVVTKKELW
jgi:hypothetical protein